MPSAKGQIRPTERLWTWYWFIHWVRNACFSLCRTSRSGNPYST